MSKEWTSGLPDSGTEEYPRKTTSGVIITENRRLERNWREFSVNDHVGFIRIVARMEDEEEDIPLAEHIAQLILSIGSDVSPAEEENHRGRRVIGKEPALAKRATCIECGSIHEYYPIAVRNLGVSGGGNAFKEVIKFGFNCIDCHSEISTRTVQHVYENTM